MLSRELFRGVFYCLGPFFVCILRILLIGPHQLHELVRDGLEECSAIIQSCILQIGNKYPTSVSGFLLFDFLLRARTIPGEWIRLLLKDTRIILSHSLGCHDRPGLLLWDKLLIVHYWMRNGYKFLG